MELPATRTLLAILGATALIAAAVGLGDARLRDQVLGGPAVAVTTPAPAAATPSPGPVKTGDASAVAPWVYSAIEVRAGSERTEVSAARVVMLVRIGLTPAGDRLAATVDEARLTALVDEIASALDGPARDAVLVPGAERLEVVAGRDGVLLDRVAAREALAEAILRGQRVVTLPAQVTLPALSTAAAQEIAARMPLAGGYTTYFPVNKAREINIGRAATELDGLLIAPGESFSFWDRLGEVSTRTGYVYAGCIIDGVSSSAIGGGLCQVSTTLFNAVARAGLRIDERHQHSYYIERYPVGMDAAVFAPTADLRWTNDTAVPVLIRSAATATSVSFWLYSAPTGRSVVLPEPVQKNLRYPAPAQPADPAHAPGYVVPGRDVWATRVVYQDGTELWTDVWYSHYAPVWGGPPR